MVTHTANINLDIFVSKYFLKKKGYFLKYIILLLLNIAVRVGQEKVIKTNTNELPLYGLLVFCALTGISFRVREVHSLSCAIQAYSASHDHEESPSEGTIEETVEKRI